YRPASTVCDKQDVDSWVLQTLACPFSKEACLSLDNYGSPSASSADWNPIIQTNTLWRVCLDLLNYNTHQKCQVSPGV
ncbi:unnamed protein product, partial [Choristocarpus tenellus]